MSLSEVGICNLAVGWLGGTLITSLDDDSIEAKLCKANYASARDAVYEDAEWSFANTRAMLTPLAAPPEFGYSHAFQLRPDTIRVLTVDDTIQGYDALDWVKEGFTILANVERIYVRYTRRVVDTALMTPSYQQCLGQRIAADICIPLTESRTLAESHWALYQRKLDQAINSDGMQGQPRQTRTRVVTGSRWGTN